MKMNSHRNAERGSAIVELAIVLPLLAFLSMMVAEGAGLVHAHAVLNNAAREGVRLATLPENFAVVGDVQAAVARYAAQNGIPVDSASVIVDQHLLIPTSAGLNIRASRVTVSYAYPLQYLAVVPFSTMPRTVALTGAAEFRNQY
jgi:Flp pilus assembly protein TadG